MLFSQAFQIEPMPHILLTNDPSVKMMPSSETTNSGYFEEISGGESNQIFDQHQTESTGVKNNSY